MIILEAYQAQWSLRSQRVVNEERRLRQDLDRCQGLIFHFSKLVSALQSNVDWQTQQSLGTHAMGDLYLPQRLLDLQAHKLQLEAFKAKEAEITGKINELANPSPAQIEETKRQHARIADLVSRRLEIDRLADRALAKLRLLLEERASLTSAMSEAAIGADFTLGADALDQVRFQNLVEALPTTLESESEAWVRSFLSTEH